MSSQPELCVPSFVTSFIKSASCCLKLFLILMVTSWNLRPSPLRVSVVFCPRFISHVFSYKLIDGKLLLLMDESPQSIWCHSEAALVISTSLDVRCHRHVLPAALWNIWSVWDSWCVTGVYGSYCECVLIQVSLPACWHLQTSHNSRHERERQTGEEEGEGQKVGGRRIAACEITEWRIFSIDYSRVATISWQKITYFVAFFKQKCKYLASCRNNFKFLH